MSMHFQKILQSDLKSGASSASLHILFLYSKGLLCKIRSQDLQDHLLALPGMDQCIISAVSCIPFFFTDACCLSFLRHTFDFFFTLCDLFKITCLNKQLIDK